jgi:hypothetical protein
MPVETIIPGRYSGEIPVGGGQSWTYVGRLGEILTIRVIAEAPPNEQNPQGLDPIVYVYDPDGTLLAEDDDSGPRFDPLLENLRLPVAGIYTIEVRSYADTTGGAYTLIVETNLPPP